MLEISFDLLGIARAVRNETIQVRFHSSVMLRLRFETNRVCHKNIF